MRRFPLALTLAVIPAMVLLIGLGVWQVQRLHWKEGLIAEAEAARGLPPVPLDQVKGLGDKAEFRAVLLPCVMGDRPYVELQSIHHGEPGVRLIAECEGYLVDLGFVSETISARPPVSAPRPPGALVPLVTAQVRRAPKPNGMEPAPADGRFYARDNAAMAKALKVEGPVSPLTLYAADSAYPYWGALKPSIPPVAFENNHLGYAATWFGLALALLGFYAAMVMRRMKP
ncbi:MAG: SURF1 family protein [Pseudomonadota bacterium]